jgi:hypothetical protein
MLTGHHPKRSNHFSVTNVITDNKEAATRATFRRMVKRPTGRKEEDDMQNNGEE